MTLSRPWSTLHERTGSLESLRLLWCAEAMRAARCWRYTLARGTGETRGGPGARARGESPGDGPGVLPGGPQLLQLLTQHLDTR